MKKLATAITGGVLGTLFGLQAHAVPIVLDFEGAGDGAQILDFYNGGTDSLGNSGTNYGISFGSAALAGIDSDAGGSTNSANEPSPDTTMFFLSGSAVLNFAAGFETGFSFFYSSATTGSVFVYDALEAAGNVLATFNLDDQNDDGCSGDPTGNFCNWTPVGLGFEGTAFSIDFGGTANFVAYDNITFGDTVPGGGGNGQVPVPATIALFGLGLLGLGMSRRKKA